MSTRKVIDMNSRKPLHIKLSFWDKVKVLFLTLWYLPKRRFNLFHRERQEAIHRAWTEVHEKDCSENRHRFIVPIDSGLNKDGKPYEYRRCKYCKCRAVYWIDMGHMNDHH